MCLEDFDEQVIKKIKQIKQLFISIFREKGVVSV
jgi:hypothetical protein